MNLETQISKGKLLLSEPFMPDPNFKRTVILLTEHNEEGTVGFVLNRVLEVSLNDVVENFPKFEAPLFYGGPVQPDTLHFVHCIGEEIKGSKKIADGLYWGGDFEQLIYKAMAQEIKPDDFRFFIGYSGWSPNQLADEIKENSWILSEATHNHIFKSNNKMMWKEILKNMGGEYKMMSNFPEDPSLN